jgi:hypothetical protein
LDLRAASPVSGDGHFGVNISKESLDALALKEVGEVHLKFVISQHLRDEKLLNLILEYLIPGTRKRGEGAIHKTWNRDVYNLSISNFSIIKERIIPFFNKYPIVGVKSLDYQDWCKIAEYKKKDNISEKDFIAILLLKEGMNKSRKNINN